jgi:hypothetical protein
MMTTKKAEELWSKERELIEGKIRSFKERSVEPFTLKYTQNAEIKKPGKAMYDVYKLMLEDDYRNMKRQLPAEDSLEFKMQIIAEAREYKERLPLMKKYNDAAASGDTKTAKEMLEKIIAFNEARYKIKSEEIVKAGKAGMADKTLRHHTLNIEKHLAESAERNIRAEQFKKRKPMKYVESAIPPEKERIDRIKEEVRKQKKEAKNKEE